MEDYRDLDEAERRLCGAIPDEPKPLVFAAKIVFAGVLAGAAWALVGLIGLAAFTLACVGIAG